MSSVYSEREGMVPNPESVPLEGRKDSFSETGGKNELERQTVKVNTEGVWV